MTKKLRGICQWFNDSKGFGFIIDAAGKKYFAHYSEISGDGHRTLEEHEPVEFTPASNFKGLRAQNIVRLKVAALTKTHK